MLRMPFMLVHLAGVMALVGLGLAGLGVAGSGAAHAKQPPGLFDDATRIQGWIASYRDEPKPDVVPELVKAMARQGLLQEQDRAGIYIGFVAGVLADNQVTADKLVAAMFPLPPAAQAIVIKSIAYSGLPDWKQRLKLVAERMPARKALMDKFVSGKEVTLDKLPLDTGPEVLDMWWGYYFATGSYQAILKILPALAWSANRDKLERLTVGSMAKWTLASHASNSKPLLDFCRSEIVYQPRATAKVLREVVAAAESFETGKIRKQAVAAIEELKAKGSATKRKWAWWGQAGQMALSVGCVAAAATGQVAFGLPCVIGGAASSAALKMLGAQ